MKIAMKIDRILCLCAVIAFPQFALAEPQFNNQSQPMEIVHAIIDFCGQVDSANASKYQERSRLMFGEAFAREHEHGHELHKAGEKTDKTIDAYAQTQTALGEISKQDAVVACKGFLESNQGGITGLAFEQEGSHEMRTH